MTIDTGSKGERVKRLQRSINKRLRARSADHRQVEVDGVFGRSTRAAMVTAAYLLGADKAVYEGMRRGTINTEEVEFVRHPGRRSQAELNRGKRRVAAYRKARAKAREELEQAIARRKEIVKLAEQAAANYRKNPGAYHYLAGGTANLVFLRPTPSHYRSDCSQFVAAVYHDAGVDSPAAPLPHQWASTYSMVKSPHARVIARDQRKPGDCGMYGSKEAPYHVELWCGDKFIGHGSPPIDSLTPGQPDYYLTFDFLH